MEYMILVTHGILGAAVSRIFTANPIAAFFIGFASHLAFDMIPHWEYQIHSAERDPNDPKIVKDMAINKQFFLDLSRFGLDALAGVVLPILLFDPHLNNPWPIFWGAIGGILPDPLQFAYFKFKHWPLTWLQRFHVWIHANISLQDSPLVGIPFQILILAAVVGISFLLTSS